MPKTLEQIISERFDTFSYSRDEDRERFLAAILQRIREVMPGEKEYRGNGNQWNAYREEMIKRLEQL